MKTMKYFSATWCGPCKVFKPVMTEIASEGYSVEFIDVDNAQDIAQRYGIRSVPSVVIEENGIEVDRFVGAQPKHMILERLS
jgi:thioredoxin 1